jgi:hypothetical protein
MHVKGVARKDFVNGILTAGQTKTTEVTRFERQKYGDR